MDAIYGVYGVIWLVSMTVQFFEYKRGLPHAWYCHLMFWAVSFLSQLSVFIVLCIERPLLIDTPEDKTFWWQAIISVGVMTLISLTLFILGLAVKNEFNARVQQPRNYLNSYQFEDSNLLLINDRFSSYS